MKKILWISPYVPYDKVNHAGGQSENFYVKGLKKAGFDIKVLSFCTSDEIKNIDLNAYNIENDIFLLKRDRVSKFIRTFRYNIFDSKYNPFNKYGNLVSNNFISIVLKRVKTYKKNGYIPDIIVLEWTEAALLTEPIKGVFPDSKILCVEEDVAYLGYKRHVDYEKNNVKKHLWQIKYSNLKKEELKALNAADFVGCLNEKDKKLLCDDGINPAKIFNWVPFFSRYDYINRNISDKCKLLFFGNMAREENYASVIWFIENVLPLLKDLDFEFNIVGAKPAEILKKYENNKVHVVGFVEDVSPYFEECLCLVAPLVLGAGIKIKVLEALSAGIPVLTNEIGIEGIPAKDGNDYFYCSNPEDYAYNIRKLYNDRDLSNKIGANAKQFINTQYDINKSLDNLCKLVNQI